MQHAACSSSVLVCIVSPHRTGVTVRPRGSGALNHKAERESLRLRRPRLPRSSLGSSTSTVPNTDLSPDPSPVGDWLTRWPGWCTDVLTY